MSGRPGAIRSMTGYGQGAAERDGLRVEVELRGVNHRFLDLKLKLPGELAALEAELRGRVQQRIARGRIDISIAQKSTRPQPSRVEVDASLVAGYLQAAAALKKQFRLGGSIGLDRVMGLPGAVSIRAEAGADADAVQALARQALDGALAAYETMRTEEGARLAADLRERLATIETAVREIESEAHDLPRRHAERLKERVAELVRDRPLDDVRLMQEVALLADRVDVTEELVRLQGYLEQIRALLDRPQGAVGKTLDFVMQEMNREANTVSSKADALTICQAALRIKSAVEKIREQVQNLE
jgi:uncharacterized protein (TIGR00255 family)